VDTLTEWRAQRWLATLASRFGTEGLRIAAAVPRLGAAVDQHAAAVRDVLQQGVLQQGSSAQHGSAQPGSNQPGSNQPGRSLTGRVLLAGYARGLLDRSGASVDKLRGRSPLWIDPDWLTLRLLAVCALHRALPPAR
jgi:Family of unknown function (DUF6401)